MIRKTTTLVFCLALVVGLFGVLPAAAAPDAPLAAISLTGGAYTQDFDTLAISGEDNTALPTGWTFSESGSNANSFYRAGTGSVNNGDTYSFGAANSTERAFGGLQSGSLVPVVGAEFQNDTGDSVTSLAISYNCEQWRLGATGRTDRLDFQYSTDATSLTTGTWTDVDSLDCLGANSTGTTGSLNGNDAANRSAVSGTITNLNIANGATFWLRWTDFNASGADDGLAADDFSLTPEGPTAVTLASFTAEAQADRVVVSWETVSETGNAGFNLYRSTDPAAPQTLLATVPSQAPGSTVGFAYSHEDLDVQAGQTYHYWLEDISLSGATTLHGPVSATVQAPTAVTLLSFSAEAQANSVLLTWETASEVDNAGFHVLRSAGLDDPQILLAVIPSQAPGSIQGFLYTYEDLDVQVGETYYYWLRDIGLSGGSSLYGPAVVEFGGPTAVGLDGLDAKSAGVAAPVVAAGLAAVVGLALAARGLAPRRRRPGQ